MLITKNCLSCVCIYGIIVGTRRWLAFAVSY